MSKNGWEDRLNKIEETLRMAAVQIAENASERRADSIHFRQEMAQFRQEMKETRDEHNREMRELRALFKRVIRKITV